MKSALLFLSLFLVLHGRPLRAAPEAAKEVEWTMTLGCRHCHFGEQTGITTCKGTCGPAAAKDGGVYLLSGTGIPKDFKKSGQWLVKGTLSPDGKAIAVKEMAFQVPAPSELKKDQSAPSAAEAKTYRGPVAHTGGGLPTLTAADQTTYHLKSSKAASAATNYTLTRIGGGELTGAFVVVGTTYEDDTHHWIVIDSIQTAK